MSSLTIASRIRRRMSSLAIGSSAIAGAPGARAGGGRATKRAASAISLGTEAVQLARQRAAGQPGGERFRQFVRRGVSHGRAYAPAGAISRLERNLR